MATLSMNKLTEELTPFYAAAGETKKVIIASALLATGADALGSIIPVLAIPSVIVSCFTAVWLMYIKLCTTLGISIKEKTLKLLAKAAISNVVANLGGVLASLAIGMIIPGASIAASAMTAFITIYIAGIVFLNLILKMAKKSNDLKGFSDVSEEEMRETIFNTPTDKNTVTEAKAAFEENR